VNYKLQNRLIKTIFILLYILGLQLLATDDFTQKLNDEQKEWLKNQKEIPIGAMEGWPPFDYLDYNAKPSGIGADIVRELNRYLDGKLVIHSSNWSDIYEKTKNGELMAILDITPKPERGEFFLFTKPYLQVPHVIVSQKSSKPYSSLQELGGKSVALEEGVGTILHLQKNYPSIIVKTYKNSSEALDALSHGEVDAYIGNRAVVNYIINQEFLDNLKIDALDISRKGSPLTIGVSKEHEILFGIVEKALDEISLESLNEIFSRHSRERTVDIGLSKSEKDYLRERKKLRFVTASEEWQPYSFMGKNGVYEGLEIDFLDLLESRIGVPIERYFIPWVEAIEGVEEQRYDAAYPVSPTPPREKSLLFSTSYYSSPISLMVAKDSLPIEKLEDFRGSSIGIIKGSALETIIKERLPSVKIVHSTSNTKDLLEMLSRKEIDGVLEYQPVLSATLKDSDNLASKIKSSVVFYSEDMSGSHYAVNKRDPTLLSIIDKAIASYTIEEKESIKDRWGCSIQKSKTPYSGEFEKGITLNQEEISWIKNNPVITVGNEYDWPPFDFYKEGEAMGLGVDYTNIIAKKTGLKVRFVQDSWESLLERFKKGEISVLHSVYKTPEREKYAIFTTPFYKSYEAMATRKDSNIKTLDDLKGKKVALLKGFGSSELLKAKYPSIIPVYVDDLYDGLKAVSFGEAEAVIESIGAMSYVVMEQTLTNLKMHRVSLKGDEGDTDLHFMTLKDGEILRNIFQKGINSITPAEKEEIRNRWVLDVQFSNEDSLNLNEEEKKWLKAHPIIRFGADFSYLPYEGVGQKGKLEGIVPDYLELIEKKLNIKFEIKEVPQGREMLDGNATDSVDMAMVYTGIGAAPREYLKSIPIIKSPLVLVMRNDEKIPFIYDLSELGYKKVAIMGEYGYIEEIRKKYPALNIINVKSEDNVLEELSSGRYDAVLCSLNFATYNISKSGLYNLVIVGKTDTLLELGFGIRGDYEIFATIIDKALNSISEEERIEILDRWVEIGFSEKIDYELILKVILFGVVLTLWLLYWNYKLKQKVDEKTAELKKVLNKLELMVQERTEELETINSEQEAIFDSASVGIALIKNRVILQCNRRMDEIFGYDLGEQIGQATYIWYKEDIDPTPIYEKIWKGEIVSWEQEVKRKDGSLFWARISGKAVDIKEPSKGVVAVIEDITKEKIATEEIKVAKTKAEEATKAKSAFLANMSHEIRTPMNAIIGMSQLALRTELNDKQKNYIEKVAVSAKNLLGIINDILDFSKIEAGKLTIEHIDFYLQDVLQNISDITALKAQEKNIELLFDIDSSTPFDLCGDPLRLGQLLLNLINNAIKFTEDGEVRLKVTPLERDQKSVLLRFEVIDSGIGIDKDELEKLFEPFAQGDSSTTRKYGGSGLGLSICKHLSKLMGGELMANSVLGKGSVFVFEVKLEMQKEQKSFRLQKGVIEHIKVLVVDDNAASREILKNMLNTLKFEAKTLSNGEKALSEIEQAANDKTPYDLVLMDWVMPKIDGIESAKMIKNSKKISNPPRIVMITAYGKEDLQNVLEESFCDGVLTKPITISTLYDTIVELFSDNKEKSKKVAKSVDIDEFRRVLKNFSVLVVEDNLVNQEFATELLELVGIKADVASNGLEALEAIEKKHFDALLMDCQMPVMDGFQATKEIRKKSGFEDMPIIAMTANAQEGDREECIASGMNDYIAKPLDMKVFYSILARVLLKDKKLEISDNLPTQTDIKIEGFDTIEALGRVGGNIELYEKLLIRFSESQNSFLERAENIAKNGMLEELIREIHSTKGLAGNIGAIKLYEELLSLESALKKSKDMKLFFEKTDILKSELLKAQESIKNYFDKGKKREEKNIKNLVVDMRKFSQEVVIFREFLAKMDTQALKMCDTICDALESIGYAEDARMIRDAVYDFEFKEADDMIAAVTRKLGEL